MGGADLWIDFAIAFLTFLCCLYVAGNMVMWAWWLRTSDALLRWFFWAVIFIKLGLAQWAGTNAYLIFRGMIDPPGATLPARCVILIGVAIQVGLTIAVFRQRKYNRGRFTWRDRDTPFPPEC